MTTDAPSCDAPDAPAVSVIVLTYNHESHIAEAIRSVLAQQNVSGLEVLIAEDCSTDQTRLIVDRLVAEAPQRLRRLPRERNLGLSANLEDAFHQCLGRYIAILEGDDVWIDARKLEKMRAAMDAHPEWTGCFHAVEYRFDGVRPPDFTPVAAPARAVVEWQDLAPMNYVPTYSAVMYRRGVVTEFPTWHRRLICGDWALHVLHAAHGGLGYLPEAMTAYRVHPNSLWSTLDESRRWQQRVLLWSLLDQHFDDRTPRVFEQVRDEFVASLHRENRRLQKIERRYRGLQLHRLAAVAKWFKEGVQSWFLGVNHSRGERTDGAN
jgi:glycosyltransferase involved in cell wall biosynthesis